MKPERICPVCGGDGEILRKDGIHADTCYRCHGHGMVGGDWKKRRAKRILEKRWLDRLTKNNPDKSSMWILSMSLCHNFPKDVINTKKPLLDFFNAEHKHETNL